MRNLCGLGLCICERRGRWVGSRAKYLGEDFVFYKGREGKPWSILSRRVMGLFQVISSFKSSFSFLYKWSAGGKNGHRDTNRAAVVIV